jgi:hypothetical protein
MKDFSVGPSDKEINEMKGEKGPWIIAGTCEADGAREHASASVKACALEEVLARRIREDSISRKHRRVFSESESSKRLDRSGAWENRGTRRRRGRVAPPLQNAMATYFHNRFSHAGQRTHTHPPCSLLLCRGKKKLLW